MTHLMLESGYIDKRRERPRPPPKHKLYAVHSQSSMLNHFSHLELACPTTGQVGLASDFAEALERLRVELDEPIYLTSACRSPMHNAKVRGHPRSLYLIVNDHWGTGGTCAVDVAATDGQYRAKLVALALAQEWSLGVASNFIHLDQRSCHSGLPQVVHHYGR